MARDIIISAKNISKIYKLYQKPSDRIKELLPWVGKRSKDFRALSNVTFELEKGDFLGVVGKNGAGKSTLLKMLSGEITPSSGELTVKGVVSLLQLGAGFNSELTGRENAVFASKILGFSNKEIERMLPQIIEFADIGDFIDQPIKTYSSGMYSRLSFAVGINVDPDILIADEVLSVGDLRFSQKCLRRMHEFKKMGKTLILVTHDAVSVSVFCNKAMWLVNGQIQEFGEALTVTERYKNYMLYGKMPDDLEVVKDKPSQIGHEKSLSDENLKLAIDEGIWVKNEDLEWMNLANTPQISDQRAKITRATLLCGKTLSEKYRFAADDTMYLLFQVTTTEHIQSPNFGYLLYDQKGIPILHSNNDICERKIERLLPNKTYTASFKIKLPSINRGQFLFAISVGQGEEMIHRLHDVFPIEIVNMTKKQDQCGYCLVQEEDFHLTEK